MIKRKNYAKRGLAILPSLSSTPITAAAFLLPFLTTTSLLLIMKSTEIVIPHFWAYIPLSICIGIIEIITGTFLLEERASQAAEIRRHIIALAGIVGISLLLMRTFSPTGKVNLLIIPIILIYAAQWLATSKIRKLIGSMEILEQYSGDYKGANLAQRMRDTTEEAGQFSRNINQIQAITIVFLVMQFGFVFISQLLSIHLSGITITVLILSVIVHFVLRFSTRQMAENQVLLHEGLRLPQSITQYRTVMVVLVIGIGLISALLISPGWSAFPPGTLIAWLSSLSKDRIVTEPDIPLQKPSMAAPNMAEMLKDLPEQEPFLRLDVFFRILGIIGFLVIIFLIIKPFFLPAFYRSIKGFHPLKRIISVLKHFIDRFFDTAREFSRFIKELFTGSGAGTKDHREAWEIPGFFMQEKLSRRKRLEWGKVVRAFNSLIIAAAESTGIRYRKHEGPGAFLVRLESLIEESAITTKILIKLNSVFYSPAALPKQELQVLLHDMKQLSSRLQKQSETE